MKSRRFILVFALIVTGIATLFYLLHFLLFRDADYIMKDLLTQLAFMPVFYFLSTMILDNIIAKRDRITRKRKLNMLVGLFFNEFGSQLIQQIGTFEEDFATVRNRLLVTDSWKESQFAEARSFLGTHSWQTSTQGGNLEELRDYLLSHRAFLVTTLENQYIQEHEAFSELLLALFHLCDELKLRTDFGTLPKADVTHLAGDIRRVSGLLFVEWLNYIEHLKTEYPYLFSLAIRTSPFVSEKAVIIR
ncbi:MAG TPA: hypothetical protein VHS59_03650 [Bacillota bacterium]|nr:hypothetical protein [Bacillota bacterium]